MRFFCSLIILFSFASCETWDYVGLNELNYGDKQHSIEVYVEGGITTQFTTHTIQLYTPADYIAKTELEQITDAELYVSSGIDTFTFLADTLSPGYYKSVNRFKAEVGKKYTLHINYNNTFYMATDSVVIAGDFEFDEIPLPQKEDIDYCPFNEGECITLSVGKHRYGFPKSNFWYWQTAKLFEDTMNYFSQSQGISYTHQYADIQGLFANIEYYFQVGYDWQPEDTLVAFKFSISDNYYDYLRAQFIETDWKEGVFSSIPGNTPTNMTTGGAGYFFASDVFVKKITIKQLLKINEQ